jgi:hypothetical protein
MGRIRRASRTIARFGPQAVTFTLHSRLTRDEPPQRTQSPRVSRAPVTALERLGRELMDGIWTRQGNRLSDSPQSPAASGGCDRHMWRFRCASSTALNMCPASRGGRVRCGPTVGLHVGVAAVEADEIAGAFVRLVEDCKGRCERLFYRVVASIGEQSAMRLGRAAWKKPPRSSLLRYSYSTS